MVIKLTLDMDNVERKLLFSGWKKQTGHPGRRYVLLSLEFPTLDVEHALNRSDSFFFHFHLFSLICLFCFRSETFVSCRRVTKMLSEICRLAISVR